MLGTDPGAMPGTWFQSYAKYWSLQVMSDTVLQINGRYCTKGQCQVLDFGAMPGTGLGINARYCPGPLPGTGL